jgi:hypothetical protein
MPRYLIIFWSGGAERGEWCLPTHRYPTRELATAAVEAAVRAGYPAYLKTERALEILGMPEGPPPDWDFVELKWRRVNRQ